MRPRVALECYDPESKWPLCVYASYTDAAAAGYSRSAIGEVIARHRKSHRGRGWRLADGSSLLAEFVRQHCIEAPDAAVPLAEFVARYQVFSPGADAQQVELRIARQYPVKLRPYGSYRRLESVIVGLNCRATAVRTAAGRLDLAPMQV